MKVSLKWLKEFIDFNAESEKIANLFNNRTMEVEKIIPYFRKKSFKNIVVGEVKSVSGHPANGRFGIAEVYGGGTIGTKTVVFTKAGLNVEVGEKLLIATKGAVFEDGLKIRDKSIFGVVSEAAFCSEKDIGFQLNMPGIIKFPSEEIGKTAYDIFDLEDTVLEFDLEPNRPDLFGVLGFAHELSAILGKEIILPEIYNGIEVIPGKIYAFQDGKLSVSVENRDLIPAYIAVKISNVKIDESGQGIKNKLIKSGVRPVNNVVDLTNIVMLETSQPLHAFDEKKLGGEQINIRLAKGGESVFTIDGKERKLINGDIVIESGQKIIALAGIMGSLSSEIDENSNSIIVESANFDMSSIRQTSRRLSLRTDASTRFEKGLHPMASIFGIKRFIYLMKKYIPDAKVECYAYDIKEMEKPQSHSIKFKDLFEFAGEAFEKGKVLTILSRLGYIVNKIEPEINGNINGNEDMFEAAPPYFRNDITGKVNIYEDILRIYGYENIKSSVPYGILNPPQKNINYELFKLIKKILRYNGFIEVINPSLVGDLELRISGSKKDEVLELKNPISADYAYFRTSLVPGNLRILSQNSKKRKNIKIFEIGKTYINASSDDYPVSEQNVLCGLLCNGIKFDKQETEFYGGKGVIEFLFKELGLRKIVYSKIEDDPVFDAYRSSGILIGGKRAGIFGEIKREILEEFKIEYKAFAFDINIDCLKEFISLKKTFIPLSKYPEIEQDISIVADSDIEYGSIERHIKGFSGLIKNVRLADIYKGKQIEKGKISFLVRYDAVSADRTLTMEEVNSLRDNLIKELNSRFGITLRS
ncbi:MAG: phenylalanine--tRNA ligase subunit beta [Deltaproteobacteria bacterium]|nr:phenylalanine--tRNA ligase subunit beta [Deltaproteobacteria bacterium]